MAVARANFILYVRDQRASTDFYRHVLDDEPALDVPGMTEFRLGDSVVLGLMPEAGIKRLLDGAVDPAAAGSVPRSEVYLLVKDPAEGRASGSPHLLARSATGHRDAGGEGPRPGEVALNADVNRWAQELRLFRILIQRGAVKYIEYSTLSMGALCARGWVVDVDAFGAARRRP
jgi:hypothetical protein